MHEHVKTGAEEDAFPAKGRPFFQHNSQYGCENSQRHEGNQKQLPRVSIAEPESRDDILVQIVIKSSQRGLYEKYAPDNHPKFGGQNSNFFHEATLLTQLIVPRLILLSYDRLIHPNSQQKGNEADSGTDVPNQWHILSRIVYCRCNYGVESVKRKRKSQSHSCQEFV